MPVNNLLKDKLIIAFLGITSCIFVIAFLVEKSTSSPDELAESFSAEIAQSLPIPEDNLEPEGSESQQAEEKSIERTLLSAIGEEKTYLVTKVIDGDTIVIEGNQVVRYIGLDAPEPGDCFNQEAFDKNKNLVLNKRVKLKKDVSETDSYGRLLRYVWQGEIFVNEYLIKQGYVYTITYPPDIEYLERFSQAREEAKESNRGLWLACYRASETETESVTDSCDNISCFQCQYCNSGICVAYCQNTDEDCGCISCLNCNDSDGWFDASSSYSCCDGNKLCSCQQQEYRDYFCSEKSCSYSVTESKIIKSGCSECGSNQYCSQGTCIVQVPSEPSEPSQPSEEIICSYNAYNCSDFSTQVEAQRVYDFCGGVNNDIHRLDRDKDGRVCETLP